MRGCADSESVKGELCHVCFKKIQKYYTAPISNALSIQAPGGMTRKDITFISPELFCVTLQSKMSGVNGMSNMDLLLCIIFAGTAYCDPHCGL